MCGGGGGAGGGGGGVSRRNNVNLAFDSSLFVLHRTVLLHQATCEVLRLCGGQSLI